MILSLRSLTLSARGVRINLRNFLYKNADVCVGFNFTKQWSSPVRKNSLVFGAPYSNLKLIERAFQRRYGGEDRDRTPPITGRKIPKTIHKVDFFISFTFTINLHRV